MVLDESQIEHYYREGYTLVKQLAPQEAVDKVMRKSSDADRSERRRAFATWR